MTLNDAPRPAAQAVLVTGGTGLVGSVLAAALLKETPSVVVLPVRAKWAPDQVTTPIFDELLAQGVGVNDALRARLVVCALPDTDKMRDLVPVCRAHGVTEIVHAAGSVDYFNAAVLEEVNVKLTGALLDVAGTIGARFIFISTAFSCGFEDGPILERLHAAPVKDPTDYTRSKREAEHLVARRAQEGGFQHLIVRPSVVVGDSSDGRYHGKPYGVYQFYVAAERLLLDKLHPEVHVVAPRAPLPVVHQDAFASVFMGAYRWSTDGAVVHAVAHLPTLPTIRDVLDTWMDAAVPFERVYIYEHLDEVPMKDLPRRMRMFSEFSAVNTEIALGSWQFETTTLDALRDKGVKIVDATPATLRTVLQWWLRSSERFQQHRAKYAEQSATIRTQLIEIPHPTKARALGA